MKERSLKPEQLDNLNLSGEALYQTLRELRRINLLLGNTRSILTGVKKCLPKSSKNPIKIIDLGCGGGDVLVTLAKFFRKKGMNAELIGIEGNPHSIQFAHESAKAFPEIRFQQADILSKDFYLPACDLLISTHFMYHFDNEELILFLRTFNKDVKIAWILGELERSRMAYFLFKLFAPLLRLSSMTQKDGLQAIRRAFRKQELLAIMEKAGLEKVEIRRSFVFRLRVIIQK